jgi:hypothetical protein
VFRIEFIDHKAVSRLCLNGFIGNRGISMIKACGANGTEGHPRGSKAPCFHHPCRASCDVDFRKPTPFLPQKPSWNACRKSVSRFEDFLLGTDGGRSCFLRNGLTLAEPHKIIGAFGLYFIASFSLVPIGFRFQL